MNFENILIKKVNSIETQKVQPLEDNYSSNKTLRDKILELSNQCTCLIKKRDIKKSFANVSKYERGESKNFRTLRQVESMFQNSVLRTIIGRDRFFLKDEIPDNKIDAINIGATQMYKELGDGSYAYKEAEKISRGIAAVYRYVVGVSREYCDSKYFIGTNDYVDAAHEIDLFVARDNYLDLVQVKNREMETRDIESIHKAHQEFINESRQHGIEYIHVLVENYSRRLHEIDPDLYGGFIDYLDEIHALLEWVKPLYDERNNRDDEYLVNNDFLNEAIEISETSEQDFSQMAVIFQKGDVLHNIFMLNNGGYASIYTKITESKGVILKKDMQKLKNEGILSFVYNEEFLNRVTKDCLNQNEVKQFSQYLKLMRSLDQWSVDHIEKMDSKESQVVFKKINELIGIQGDLVIQKSDTLCSVVAHGNKVEKKILT
jgi:hypothetical protein